MLLDDKIIQAVEGMLANYKAYGYVKYPNAKSMLAWIRGYIAEGCYLEAGGYLVLYDVTTPPWADDRILQEQLVLWLGPERRIREVVPALMAVAMEKRCDLVSVGDSSPGQRMNNIYTQRQGFKPATQIYYKELQYG